MAATVKGELPHLEPLKKLARDQLRDILVSAHHGAKDLFIDPSLMKPIDRLADIKFLKEHGVDKIYKIETPKAVQGNTQRIYITRPTVSTVKLLVGQIKSEKSIQQNRQYTLVMVPRSLYVCEKILEEEGIFGYVKIKTLELELLPLDKDILSMELDFFYTSCFLHHDETWVHSVACALASLQTQFGLLTNHHAIGQCAKNVWDLSKTIMEYKGTLETSIPGQIGHVILMDRDVDLVTPLCSQVTYEGLLDDTFGIKCGVVEFDKEVTGTDKSVKLPLNSSDEVFEEIRNKHFSTVFQYLSSRAKAIQKDYDKKDDMSVKQMKDFVANDLQALKHQHRSLTLHISACEVITKRKTAGGDLEEMLATEHGLLEGHSTSENVRYIEDSINQQSNKINVLRLMCLLSIVRDGLSHDTYESLKTLFLQSHGYQYLVTFHNLAKLGLLTKKQATPQTTVKLPGGSGSSIKLATDKLRLPKKSSFQILSKNLHLELSPAELEQRFAGMIPKSGEEPNLRSPTNMSYVFSGAYTPLSCKLVELIVQKRGFSGIEDSIKLITGVYESSTKPQSARVTKSVAGQMRDVREQTVLVVFVGGVTYSEIACLRFLGHITGCKFLIMTTNIITGNRLISGLLDT